MTHASGIPATAEAERWGLRLALVLSGLLAVRLVTLGAAQTELMFDEAQYWAWSRELAFGYFSKPPMIAWAIAATTRLCGDGEACVRLAAPLFHTATAFMIYLAGARLFDARIGFWSAIVFATVPGASFSATLIATDAPLLFFWAAALLAWIVLLETRAWGAALGLGAAIGLGLLSKYAMIYFYLGAAIWLAFDRDARWLLRDWRGVALLAIPAALIAPNVVWNLDNGLVTFAHTADNASWGASLGNPINALEFVAAQFGVFGPVLFAVLIWAAVRGVRGELSREERMLLAFSLPIVLLIAVQAFVSRAHANWAAAAYPAAAILVTALLLKADWRRLFAASLGLHLFVQGAISIGVATPNIALPGAIDPFARVLGWQETARAVRAELAQGGYRAVVTDGRALTAEMLYYLRDSDVPIHAWPRGETPRDHFELTRPYGPSAPEPALLVTEWPGSRHVTRAFASVTEQGAATVAAGPKTRRTVHFFRLEGYEGAAP